MSTESIPSRHGPTIGFSREYSGSFSRKPRGGDRWYPPRKNSWEGHHQETGHCVGNTLWKDPGLEPVHTRQGEGEMGRQGSSPKRHMPGKKSHTGAKKTLGTWESNQGRRKITQRGKIKYQKKSKRAHLKRERNPRREEPKEKSKLG